MRHRGQILTERGQQPSKLAALVKPEAYSCPLFVLKALRQLVEEGFEDHHTIFATRSTPTFCRGSMLTFTPSSRSGSQPLGRSAGHLPGRQYPVVSIAAVRAFVVSLLDSLQSPVQLLRLF